MSYFDFVYKESRDFGFVEAQFKSLVQPIYGDQSYALRKIGDGVDRTCRVLFENSVPVGLIVTKKAVSNEYGHLNIRNASELKTLLVADPEKNGGRGFESKLLDEAEKVARNKEASGVFVTVSEKQSETLAFFKNNGYLAIRSYHDKHSRNTAEILLHKSFKVPTPSDYVPMTLKDVYIQQINQRSKTIEGRIDSGVFANLLPGSRMRFYSNRSEVFCLITKVIKYKTFKELLEGEGFRMCIPTARSLDAAAGEYAAIPGYPEREKNFGVVALELKVEPKPLDNARTDPLPVQADLHRADPFDLPDAKRKK